MKLMFNVSVFHLSLPMATTFAHSQAERKTAETIICSIRYGCTIGLGECVPRKYVTGESIESVMDVLKSVDYENILKLLDMSSLNNAIQSFNSIKIQQFKDYPNATCVFEMAVLDLIGNYFKVSLSEILRQFYLPENLHSNSTTASLPTSQVMDFSISVDEFIKSRGPFHYIKIKLDTDLYENVQKVKSLRQILGNNIKISVDVNMAWDFDTAIINMQKLKDFNIDYYEEPLPKGSHTEYKALRDLTGCKIMLDESLCLITDAEEAISKQSCDAFNIRLSKCGGLRNSISLLKLATTNLISYQIGAQVAETGPLISAARHLASATKDYITYEAGQPDRYFASNYIFEPMPLVDRVNNLASKFTTPGLGVKMSSNFNKFIMNSFNL